MKSFTIWLLPAALALAGCSRQPGGSTASAASPTPADGASESKAQYFTVPLDQMAHVQVVPVESTRLPRVLRLTGSVAYNNFETTPVISQVGGPVSRIISLPGQEVKQGEAMLYVSSPDYAQLRTNYSKAKAAYLVAQKAYVRAKELFDRGAISQANLELAEATTD